MLPFDPIRNYRERFPQAESRWEKFRLASEAHEAGEASAAQPTHEFVREIFRAAEKSDDFMEFAPGSLRSPAQWLARHAPAEAVRTLASLVRNNSDSAAMAAEDVVTQLGHEALPLYAAASAGPCSFYCLLGLVRAATLTARPSPALEAAAVDLADRMFRNPHPRVLVEIVTTSVGLGAGRWLPQLRAVRAGPEIATALLANEFLHAHQEGGDAAALAARDRFAFGLPHAAFARMEWPAALRPLLAQVEPRLALCVRLRTTTGPAGTVSSASQLGGAPLLSPAAPWPDRSDCYFVGRIAQDIFAAAGQPNLGTLQFWLESGSFESGGFLDCASTGVVAPVPPASAVATEHAELCPWQPCPVRFETCLSLDGDDHTPDAKTPAGQLHQALDALASGIGQDPLEGLHQIGGHPPYDGKLAIEDGGKPDGVPLLCLTGDRRMGLGFPDTGCLVFALTPAEFAAADTRSVGTGIRYA